MEIKLKKTYIIDIKNILLMESYIVGIALIGMWVNTPKYSSTIDHISDTLQNADVSSWVVLALFSFVIIKLNIREKIKK